jgi:hypothetical protein
VVIVVAVGSVGSVVVVGVVSVVAGSPVVPTWVGSAVGSGEVVVGAVSELLLASGPLVDPVVSELLSPQARAHETSNRAV